ncbi:hypothetical protein niasHT_032592 [Heterodera trifolii]|uniref:Uncharacterized protein n=1 Tax=Heterodera trifolii TaxID=157864 RepID=A0ABD2IML4_9BILA
MSKMNEHCMCVRVHGQRMPLGTTHDQLAHKRPPPRGRRMAFLLPIQAWPDERASAAPCEYGTRLLAPPRHQCPIIVPGIVVPISEAKGCKLGRGGDEGPIGQRVGQ